jgi:O-antigen/teichoic acid export membrane protein
MASGKLQSEDASSAPPLATGPAARVGLVSSAGLTLGTRVATFLLSVVTNVVLARALGPEGRGIYAVAVLIPGLIGLLLGFGISPANVYHYSKKLISADELIGTATASALVLGAACYITLFAYIRISGSAYVAGIRSTFLLVSCLAVPFLLQTASLQGLLVGAERFVLYNLTFLSQSAATMAAVILIVVVFRGSTMGAVVAWTLSAAIASAVAAASAGTLGRMSLGLRWATLRRLLGFGLFSYLSSLTSFVNLRFDVLLVNLFAGTRQVGLYSVGTSLAEVVWYIASAAGTVLAPRVAASNSEKADRTTEAVSRVVALLAVMAAIGLGLLAPWVVVLFFGPDFSDSRWAVWLLLPGIVTFSVARVMSMYLLGRNQLRIDLLASFIGFVVTLALDLVLIPRFGFRGAAVASSIAYTSTMFVDILWATRRSTITLRGLLLVRGADVALLVRRVADTAASGFAAVRHVRASVAGRR